VEEGMTFAGEGLLSPEVTLLKVSESMAMKMSYGLE
jgi:hypothetical protein